MIPTIGVAAGSLVLAGLGTWQVRRMGEAADVRAAVAARVAEPPFDASSPPADPDRRRARVTGTPAWDRYLLVAGRYHGDEPGYELVVPVATARGGVLVDLGWIPGEAPESVVARERSLGEVRTFEGLARVYPASDDARGALPAEPDGFQRLWRAISPAMGQGYAVADFVVQEGSELAEGRPNPDREPPIGGWDPTPPQRPHGEYAVTWFSILGVLIGLWVYGSLERPDGSRPR